LHKVILPCKTSLWEKLKRTLEKRHLRPVFKPIIKLNAILH